MEHNVIPAGERHGPHQWVVANEAARLALNPASGDVGSYCWQQSDNTEWMLLSLGPATWQERGAQGEAGPQGDEGPQGEQGEQGETGPQGTGLNIIGALDDESELPGSGDPGDAYLIDGDLWVWGGSAWESAGNIQGPQGLPGADGADGSPGAPGSDGADGADGADGRTIHNGTGVPDTGLGADGDFYIRTSDTTLYGPKASGAWGSPISLIGPQGETGEAGAPGAEGDAGAPGADGDDGADGSDGRTVLSGSTVPDNATDGVDGDFYIRTGTWTIYGPKTAGAWGSPTSLIGPPGADGEDGAPGAPGADGEDGADGTVIPGGTTGQVLAKASNDDGDVAWVDLPTEEPIEDTLTELEGSDTIIVFRAGVPYEVTLAAIATFVGVPPDETAPAAFETGDWTATADVEEIDLNITALPDDGGATITTLQYRLDGGTAVDLTGTGTGARTITGLTGGVEYDVQIRAVNAIGAGSWSDIKTRTALAEPTVPEAFEVGDWTITAADTEADIDIDALPGNGGSPITALEYRIDGGTAASLTGTGLGVRTIGSLTNDTEYDFEIRAVNAIGNGAWSDVKAVTPVAAGGSGAEFLELTHATGSGGTVTLTRPAGATAGDTIYAVLSGVDGSAMAAYTTGPTGWTLVASPHSVGPTFQIFSAAGDVADLTFNVAGIADCFALGVRGTVSAVAALGHSYDLNDGVDPGSPSVTAPSGGFVVSTFLQFQSGAGAITDGGITSGYTPRTYIKDDAIPYASVLTRSGVSSGATGAIQHGSNAQYTSRVTMTVALEA